MVGAAATGRGALFLNMLICRILASDDHEQANSRTPAATSRLCRTGVLLLCGNTAMVCSPVGRTAAMRMRLPLRIGKPAWRAVAVTNVGLDQHVSGGWVGMHSDAIYAGRQPPPGGNPSSQVQPDQCHRRHVWLVLATAKGGHQAGYGPGGGRVPAATPQPDSSSGGEVGVSWSEQRPAPPRRRPG